MKISFDTSELIIELPQILDIIRSNPWNQYTLCINQDIWVEHGLLFVDECTMSLSFFECFDEVWNQGHRIR